MKRLHKYLSCGYGSLTYTKYKYLPFQSLYRFNSTNLNINSTEDSGKDGKKYSIKDGPGLKDFLMSDAPLNNISIAEENIPYIEESPPSYNRRVFFDVYGCQMNVNDTEVVWSILQKKNFLKVDVVENADVILMITCAIREGAENKIWKRLEYYKALKKRRTKSITPIKVGVLGCMAERLKHKLIEKEKSVDVVAGPDSYKDLPRLLALTENNQYAINVLLSLDETYADVMPVRLNEDSKTAFVSIMRGCDNMCTYCIVPFTRGKERSRPTSSIVDEVKHLSNQGVKEVTLLGQNVNSYRDLSEDDDIAATTNLVKGFKTVYKLKKGGLRFADLLDKISLIDPEMRIRFTSPHPKDFPDEVLQIIKERPNICNSLHLPAQSGSSSVLERMRRGYNREAYLDLIDRVREVLPDVSLSSDFICGFCHETDEEFNDTISLMETVKYNVAFLFPYSMREKTTAHRRYTDDVPDNIKHERLLRMAEVYRRRASEINNLSVGKIQLILIEGISKRSDNMLAGRNDGNIKVIIPKGTVPGMVDSNDFKNISPGDYIVVRIDSATSQTFKGTPLCHSTLQMFANNTYDSYINNLKSIENV